MKELTKFGLTGLLGAALLLPGSSFAEQHPGRPVIPAFDQKHQNPARPMPAFGQNRQNGGRQQDSKPRPGKWLREHSNLPPQEQEKALEKDPDYQKLPAQRQEQLKERLRRFNNLPPEQREKTIQRMQAIEQLPPDKRQLLQNSMSQFAFLPQERRQMLRKAYRNLREMQPEERDRVMNSDRFKGSFNDNERSILNGLLQSGVDFNGGGHPADDGSTAPR